jgi:hypothetical protein
MLLAGAVAQSHHWPHIPCCSCRSEGPTWCDIAERPAPTSRFVCNKPAKRRLVVTRRVRWAMLSLADWPNETIGHIFLAVVAAQKGLPGAIFAERQVLLVLVVCGRCFSISMLWAQSCGGAFLMAIPAAIHPTPCSRAVPRSLQYAKTFERR